MPEMDWTHPLIVNNLYHMSSQPGTHQERENEATQETPGAVI